MKTPIAIALMLAAAVPCMSARVTTPEPDSAAAINARIRADFPYTLQEFEAIAAARYPGYTPEKIRRGIEKHYIETMVIDDSLRVFRKAPRNLGLLDPALNGGWTSRNWDVEPARIAGVDSILAFYDAGHAVGPGKRVTYRFSIDVPYSPDIVGDTLRVWMPVPLTTSRQSGIEILNASPARYTLSDRRSVHNTIYFSAPAPAPGDTAHFEYTGRYDVRAQYFSPEFIRAHMRPYDRGSELYRRYTAVEEPHMVRMDSLAALLADTVTDPYALSERVYEYIDTTYPWAGAREYSTIPCIPRYVVAEGHGDCGQVSLLYISLMRTMGIPARWESGWMLHPGEQNYHDWAEVYFEGVGWVPVDASFGRFPGAADPRARKYYSTGTDAYRFATNSGIGGAMYPPKRFVRSETVDHQAGEVECSRGNIYWPAWNQNLEIIDITPLDPQ